MRSGKHVAFGVFASLVSIGVLIVFAQGGNIFPTSNASGIYQAGGANFFQCFGGEAGKHLEINPGGAVAWEFIDNGSNLTPVIFAPSSKFSMFALAPGLTIVAGVAFEAQRTSSNVRRVDTSAERSQLFTAGVANLEMTLLNEMTENVSAEFRGDLVGGGLTDAMLLSFTFEIDSSGLEALADGEQLTLDVKNNEEAFPLYTITESQIIVAADGQAMVLSVHFLPY